MAFRLIKHKNKINENVKVPFWVTLFGSGFYTGFTPLASGTVGSLLAFGIYLIPRFSEWYYLLASIIVFFFIGLYCAEKMRGRWGEDPPEVTIDEIVGQWFTYLIGSVVFELFFSFKSFDPEFKFATKLVFAVIGFLVFRFFDIIKLEPAKYFDKKDSGLGIMLDDVISGLYAGIFTSVITHFMWYKVLAHYFR